LASCITNAQSNPRVELFTGYSNLQENIPILPIDQKGENLNGLNTSVTVKLTKRIGVTTEYTGYFKSSQRIDRNLQTFLGGPRFSATAGRAQIFGHILFGGARFHRDGFTFINFENKPVEIPEFSETAIAAGFGGGLDYKLNERVSLRLIQGDVLVSRLETVPTAGRLSFGVVLNFGKIK
jgi:hypothetical protein